MQQLLSLEEKSQQIIQKGDDKILELTYFINYFWVLSVNKWLNFTNWLQVHNVLVLSVSHVVLSFTQLGHFL